MKCNLWHLVPAPVMALPEYAMAYDDSSRHNGERCQQYGIAVKTVNKIQPQIFSVRQLPNGGFFSPSRMWSAIVDRQGVLCSVIRMGDAWPGSRAITLAKANTANGFSNDALGLSTANFYGPTQLGGPLYELNNSNPFSSDFLPQDSGIDRVSGDVITFSSGLALYENGRAIGGLGLSRDTPVREPRDCLWNATPGAPGCNSRRCRPRQYRQHPIRCARHGANRVRTFPLRR